MEAKSNSVATPEVTEKLVRRAAAGKPSAVAEVAGLFYPSVVRSSVGLTGRDDLGQQVARTVLRRSVHAMRNWQDEHAPERWYRHHTTIEVRHALAHNIGTRRDALLAEGADQHAVAFLAAVRKLPHQQREAFLLHHAEKLGPRSLAVSMDCSVEAASNHLHAADKALRLLAPDFEAQVDRLIAAWAKLTPPPPQAVKYVDRQTRRALFPRRVRRLLEWVVFLAFLAGLGVGGYYLWRFIET